MASSNGLLDDAELKGFVPKSVVGRGLRIYHAIDKKPVL